MPDVYVQSQLIQQPLNDNDVVHTPSWVAMDIIEKFDPKGKILEPCRGKGSIFEYFPKNSTQDWCEISEGKDFFEYKEKVDWIITNPPYSMLKEFLEHSYRVAKNIVLLIPVHNFFRSGSLVNLARENGWIKHIRWYGNGKALNFPMGNPIGAVYFQKGYIGPTEWSNCKKDVKHGLAAEISK